MKFCLKAIFLYQWSINADVTVMVTKNKGMKSAHVFTENLQYVRFSATCSQCFTEKYTAVNTYINKHKGNYLRIVGI